MSDKIKDGGSAFPSRSNINGESFAVNVYGDKTTPPHLEIVQPGMSLRDHFAAKAMSGAIGNDALLLELSGSDTSNLSSAIAHYCYNIADAMIVEREKTK